ncbi:hypothetical protein H2200_008671 [Cladophialophora chaetospira]|uniref:Uncharacterized protein n=1 Tax=Cladophialophora chaetospira TaxID=386627 RepID=A0AA38X4I3_9EURO|nr:hypothetical protein H2200_008671 [Cladophialophora chaetospira]
MTTVMEPNLMPGTFLPENDFSVHCARFKASPFLPPDISDTPSSSSSWSQRPELIRPLNSASSSARASEDRQYSRKRPRLNTRPAPNDSYFTLRSAHCDALSPSPLVNTNYRIAGGLDTPNAGFSQREEDVHEFDFEIDCRPNRCTRPKSRPTSDSYFPQTPAPDHDGRYKRRPSPPSPPMKGWGKTVWALTGGIAGKVINFCWTTTFKGFHAGGGNGYRFDVGTPGVASNAWTEVDSKDDVFHNDYDGPSRRGERDSTPVPGGFPAEEPKFIEDYMSQLTVNQDQGKHLTPTKGRRDESPSISRYNSWVVVDSGDGDSRSRKSSPVRKKSKASTANLYAARPSPAPQNLSHTLSRPRLTPRSSTGRSSASYASPRLSTGSNPTTQHEPRRSKSSNPVLDSHQNDGHQDARPSKRPSSSHANRPSLVASRRQSSIPHSSPTQKPSPEVRKFEQKLRKKEAKQDRTMNHFNDRLQEMIREGQAALGSRIEVEMQDDDEDLDEGFYEDDVRKAAGGTAWQREDNRYWSRS